MSAAPRNRRFLLGGTMLALALALAGVWAFVLQPATDDGIIGVDDLVNSDATASSGTDVAEVGAPAPDVTLTSFDGATVTTASLRGKVTVINFWASTCAPCVQEMPLLERVHQQLGDSVAFIGVDAFESPDLGRPMIASTGVTYLQTVDPTNEVLTRFGGTQLPHTVVLRADGTVAGLHRTAITDDQTLLDMIEAAR